MKEKKNRKRNYKLLFDVSIEVLDGFTLLWSVNNQDKIRMKRKKKTKKRIRCIFGLLRCRMKFDY